MLKKIDLTEDNASKLQQFSKEWKDANDKWNAMWGVKIEQTKDGKYYVAILSLYNRGDRRRWYWPCPHCGDWFQPAMENMVGYGGGTDQSPAGQSGTDRYANGTNAGNHSCRY
nr:phage terminase large subunit family protein [Salmonella enterica]